MALVVLASAKGSPGVTTLASALATAWPSEGRHVFLVEADAAGGTLAARWNLAYEPGLLSLAGAGRHGIDLELLERHSQPFGSVSALCGPASPEQARSALAAIAPHLAAVAGRRDIDVIVDLGRLSASSPAVTLARDAGTCLVLCRPVLEHVQHVPYLVRALGELRAAPAIVTVGDRPYRPEDVADYAGAPLLHVLADDPAGARVFAGRGSSRALRRSPLWRSTVALAERLATELRPRLAEPGAADRRALDDGGDRQLHPAEAP